MAVGQTGVRKAASALRAMTKAEERAITRVMTIPLGLLEFAHKLNGGTHLLNAFRQRLGDDDRGVGGGNRSRDHRVDVGRRVDEHDLGPVPLELLERAGYGDAFE